MKNILMICFVVGGCAIGIPVALFHGGQDAIMGLVGLLCIIGAAGAWFVSNYIAAHHARSDGAKVIDGIVTIIGVASMLIGAWVWIAIAASGGSPSNP
jgi:hypothetical protein